MNQVRPPAVAGTFYPGNAVQLSHDVEHLLQEAATTASCPKAIIAPHAGYIYSGPIAAALYSRVKNAADRITTVVLLGPSHRVGFEGIAASSADMFRTPLGDIPLDKSQIGQIIGLPNTGYLDKAHDQEHSLEVHLPFLQAALNEFQLIPLVVGDAAPEDVARVLQNLWGGDETLVVISSDLSHYQNYTEAQSTDRETALQIESLSNSIKGDQACGCRPINGLMQLARQKSLSVEAIDVRNSGDTAGTKDRVVGYGAFIVNPSDIDSNNITSTDESEVKSPDQSSPAAAPEDQINQAHRQVLLQLARNAIQHGLANRTEFDVPLDTIPDELKVNLASFVTINLAGRLRGCIGSLVAHRPLVEDIVYNAQAAAFKDPRFSPLSPREFKNIELHLSVLSPTEPVVVASRQDLLGIIRPGIDGLIIDDRGHRATYLPSVWDQLPDPEQFISELRVKAGLSRSGWSEDTQVFRYTTEEFS